MTKRITEAERRAAANRGRKTESRSDIVSRLLTRTGDGRLMASLPPKSGEAAAGPIDLTHLDRFPGLREPFARGYVLHCASDLSDVRRRHIDQQIRSGFLSFLDHKEEAARETGGKRWTAIGIDEITGALLLDFKSWLDDETLPDFTPSELSRRCKIQDVQLVLEQLMADDVWRQRLSPDLKLIRKPYPGAHRKVNHTEILDDATLERLFVAAADEVEETIVRTEDQDQELNGLLHGGLITKPEQIDGDPVRCAAYLLQTFGSQPPTYGHLKLSPRRRRAIGEDLFREACAVLFPGIRELVPFVLLLALLFAFNPGVILNMTHNDYDDDTFAGRPRIRLFPYKPRKGSRHRNSVLATEDFDNPARILAFLMKRTERLGRILRDQSFADRVFLRYTDTYRLGLPLEESDVPWRTALDAFCDRHGIDRFTLQQIRPTTLDLVHELTGGNMLATQQAAGHESPDTTKTFYTSSAMQRTDEELLGGGINQFWRFVTSGGKVDATERDRLNADLGAATPGFACADPYDSPMEGERKGALCGAYGRCPMCEHALIDLSSPHAYAYQRELLTRIDEAQARLGPPWLTRWAPVKEKLLVRCLSAFPDETKLASGAVSIPALPEVD